MDKLSQKMKKLAQITGVGFSLQLKDSLDKLCGQADRILKEQNIRIKLETALKALMFYKDNYSKKALEEHLQIISQVDGIKIEGNLLVVGDIKVEMREDLRILIRENNQRFREEQIKKQSELLKKFWKREIFPKVYNDPNQINCVYIEVGMTTWAIFVDLSSETGFLTTKCCEYGGLINNTPLPCDHNPKLNELLMTAIYYLRN